jgi:hypothetical protein
MIPWDMTVRPYLCHHFYLSVAECKELNKPDIPALFAFTHLLRQFLPDLQAAF